MKRQLKNLRLVQHIKQKDKDLLLAPNICIYNNLTYSGPPCFLFIRTCHQQQTRNITTIKRTTAPIEIKKAEALCCDPPGGGDMYVTSENI